MHRIIRISIDGIVRPSSVHLWLSQTAVLVIRSRHGGSVLIEIRLEQDLLARITNSFSSTHHSARTE